ncbi:MAG TPA: hypothetical protein VNW51_03905, partial [Mucilaginibacter sp.]|nr:hypothetical protein [Mucilaginibacter sp.]
MNLNRLSKYFLLACFLSGLFACSKTKKQQSVLKPEPTDIIPEGKYKNPVFEPILADPAVIKDTATATFYAYGTEDDWGDGKGDHLVAIVKSTNLK